MDLIDEEDCARGFQLVDDALQAFLELAAVHGAGHQRTHVELQEALAHERRGHIVGDNALCQAFHDGRLAHPGLADEGRVVLGAAGEDLNDPFDFGFASDDRVELVLLSQRGQVGGQLIDEGCLGFVGLGAGRGRLACLGRGFLQQAARLAANLFRADAQAAQHVDGHALRLAHNAQQQVFGADVVMAEAARLVDGQLQHLFGIGREIDAFGGRAARRGLALDHFLDALGLQPQLAQHASGHTAFLADEAEQQVLGADGRVMQSLSLLMGQAEHTSCALSKAF